MDTQKEIARLVQERANLYHRIETAREEYECLKVVQATGITDYQAQLNHASKVRTCASIAVTARHVEYCIDQKNFHR